MIWKNFDAAESMTSWPIKKYCVQQICRIQRPMKPGIIRGASGHYLTNLLLKEKKLIDRVKNIDEATASIVALHPRLQTPMRLIDSLFFVAEHDDHELGKIRSLIQ